MIETPPAGGMVSRVGVNLCRVLTMPAQLGPTTRMPLCRATSATSCSAARSPISEKPAVMITAAVTPALPQSSRTAGTVDGGETITARSTGPGMWETAS